MSTTLARLRQDHNSVSIVLSVIDREIDTAAGGNDPDADLLFHAILYFKHYYIRFHQAKEDLIFGHLILHVPAFAQEVYSLLEVHRALFEEIGILERSVNSLCWDDPPSRERFCTAARIFVSRQRQHLGAEEKYFYPNAEQWLTVQEWAEVDRYLPDERDPLTGLVASASIEKLADAIRSISAERSSRDTLSSIVP
jgi:hemerythrin-like domain-containing protein